MMRLFIPILMTIACGSPDAVDDTLVVETGPLIDTFAAIDLEPLVGLLVQPLAGLNTQADCPRLTILASTEDTAHERWQGGCALVDGSIITGTLERFEGPNSTWIAGKDFRIAQGAALVFGIDGAIELAETDALWLVDVAVAFCGTERWPCTDGVVGLDLAYTIYPAATFPGDYDTTVSGVVATETRTITLDGAYSIDTAQCAIEPVWGMLSIHSGAHHALTLNGRGACDGCAVLQVQGLSAPDVCGLNP